MDRAVKGMHGPGSYSSLPLYIPHRIQSTGALDDKLAPPYRDQYVIGDRWWNKQPYMSGTSVFVCFSRWPGRDKRIQFPNKIHIDPKLGLGEGKFSARERHWEIELTDIHRKRDCNDNQGWLKYIHAPKQTDLLGDHLFPRCLASSVVGAWDS